MATQCSGSGKTTKRIFQCSSSLAVYSTVAVQHSDNRAMRRTQCVCIYAERLADQVACDLWLTRTVCVFDAVRMDTNMEAQHFVSGSLWQFVGMFV